MRQRILDKEITTTALINTGFETDKPQILVPDRLPIASGADLFGLHGTASGAIAMFVARGACKLALVEPDGVVGDVVTGPGDAPLGPERFCSA